MPPEPRGRANTLEKACSNLLQDIDEVLERMGEAWWEETVTSGNHHRCEAEKLLGRTPYRPLDDAADQENPPGLP